MSDSVQPHRRQPTRLPHPWDSPGKNTGVGCHFLLQCMKVKSESEVARLCPTLSDPMDCSLQGSSIHGIYQQLSAIRLLKGEKQVPTYYLFESPYKNPVVFLFLRFTTILLETEQRGEENWPFKRQTLYLHFYFFFPTHQMTKSWKPLLLYLHTTLKYQIAGWGCVFPRACLCSCCSQPESTSLSFSVYHIL